MTAAQGTSGHLRRLAWTQLKLPSLCRLKQSGVGSPLLFSPIPEAPLFSSTRFVVTFHDLIPLRFPQFFGSIKLFYKHYVPQVLRQSERVICNSEATARDIVNFYGISAHKLVPIPLAYDARHFRPVSELPSIWQNQPAPMPYFLMLGRQAPYKNIGRVIEALAQTKADCTLLIAGPTDERYTPRTDRSSRSTRGAIAPKIPQLRPL